MASYIPAITYSGPVVDADKPSPESVKFPKSVVILEFLADLCPNSGMRTTDLVLRAKARLFIAVLDPKIIDASRSFFCTNEQANKLLDTLDALQKMLPSETRLTVGDAWTIAYMVSASLLARFEMLLLANELGTSPRGEDEKVLDALQARKLAWCNRYMKGLDRFLGYLGRGE